MSDYDDVNNPKHYDLFPNQQVIDVIQASLTAEEFAGYCKGNALKYRLRAGDKGDALKCIAKANWYQNKLREVKETSADVEWPDESRIDAIGQNGNDGQHYRTLALPEDAIIPGSAHFVVVYENGQMVAHDLKPVFVQGCWQAAAGNQYIGLGDGSQAGLYERTPEDVWVRVGACQKSSHTRDTL